ncbi:hypothetical protein CROQUDRAFT_50994 [Cronartium quercuum f. sp. fusiforme G11]|uniref:NF-X1-type domain-containing protein n=1 Tax=Cronartium quercuum f. sp. fusiforme G11 TaxID=708437 RepID=A0A9P6N8N2_9BASI|nr:hypothetical protein CROQUDRAFT_50994 [Cronartium quercuum f. sp. fusiforme G11]
MLTLPLATADSSSAGREIRIAESIDSHQSRGRGHGRGRGRDRGRGRGRDRGRGQGRGQGRGRGRDRAHTQPDGDNRNPSSTSANGSSQPRIRGRGFRGRGQGLNLERNRLNPAFDEAGGAVPEPGPSQAGSASVDHSLPLQNARRQNFGAKLTAQPAGSTSQTQVTASQPMVPAINFLSSDDLSLSARLTLELSTSVYECLICFSTVTPNQPIYHCPKCFVVFHLRCSSEWASRSVVDTSTRAQLLHDRDGIPCPEEAARGFWRCPGCQDRQIGEESVPTVYRCWCGKVEHPQRRNTCKPLEDGRPSPSIPHGCGMICDKIIAQGCVHRCALECHPGSCPACAAVVETPCHCRKTQRVVRCSQLHPIQRHLNPINDAILSCGQPCGRRLNCGLHFCNLPCHVGDCEECEIVRDKSCYCGAVLISDEKCSSFNGSTCVSKTAPPTCYSPEGSGWIGEFSCKAPCPWKFDCHIHSCPSTCHPHPPDAITCPFSPASLKTCPCGASPQLTRSTCADPVATCQNPCLKSISSCGHLCRKTCHNGPCGPCKELVTTVCRCGKDSIVRPCTEVESIRQAAIDTAENERQDQKLDLIAIGAEAVEYHCEHVCRVLRHCGKHTCNRACCPLAFLETLMKTGKNKKSQSAHQLEEQDPEGLHRCNLICNKKLNCGLHFCQLRDHKGPCPSCLDANFNEVVCHCGSTVIQPPVPCGTVLNCNQACRREPLPCGHPKAPHQCHEGECPPCPFLTNKPCQCGKNIIRNVRCSQPKVICGQICESLLTCGAHRCRKTCHTAGECGVCDQLCLKPRKYCGHGCQIKCHAPSSCSIEEPCETVIDIKCQCGHITQKVNCSSCESRPEGNRDRVLKCNNDCAIYQRNLALASAFVDPEATHTNSRSEIEWSTELLQFCQHNLSFAKSIENILGDFLKCQPTKTSYLFRPQNHAKRKFTCELAEVYGLTCECLDQVEPRRSVKVTRQPTSRIPQLLLSQAFEATRTAQLNSSARVPQLRTNFLSLSSNENRHQESDAILLQGVFGHDADSLRSLIGPTIGTNGFESTWIKDEDVLLKVSVTQPSKTAQGWLINERPEARLTKICTSLKSLLEQIPFCSEIAIVRIDGHGQVLERKFGGWKSVGSAEGSRNTWDKKSSAISISNSFGALSLNQQKKVDQGALEKQNWVGGEVLGGGFNRRMLHDFGQLHLTSVTY